MSKGTDGGDVDLKATVQLSGDALADLLEQVKLVRQARQAGALGEAPAALRPGAAAATVPAPARSGPLPAPRPAPRDPPVAAARSEDDADDERRSTGAPGADGELTPGPVPAAEPLSRWRRSL